MCSNNQPKMFQAADPLGTGGTFAPSTAYASNAQPTAAAAPVTPPTPAPVGGGAPGNNTSNEMMRVGPANFNPPRVGGGMRSIKSILGY